MAQASVNWIAGLALTAFAGTGFCALAQEPPSAPVDPTAIIEVEPPAPDWAKVPPELSVMSAQCSVPRGDLATMAPGFARTIEKLSGTKELRILAIGSSSTWGVGASSMKRNYPSRLEAILSNIWKGVDVDIINRGVGGELAAQTAWRMLDEIDLIKPDLVLWQVGTNDALNNIPLDRIEKTLRETIAELRKRNIDLVLVGLQYTPKLSRHEHYFKVRKVLDEVAASEKLLYVRRYRAMEYIANTKANLHMLASDNFHLNDLGYQCMAEHIAQAVVANLFIRRQDKQQALQQDKQVVPAGTASLDK